jgi:hypothetical protein
MAEPFYRRRWHWTAYASAWVTAVVTVELVLIVSLWLR